MKKRSWGLPGLAVSLVLAACAAPVATSVVKVGTSAGSSRGTVTFHEATDGSGMITIRLIDERPRAVQDLSDADPGYNGVLFRLNNSAKLKDDRQVAVAAAGSVYTAVFTGLPSDASGRYTLTAGLFRGVTSATSPADPAYHDLTKKVGEGGSAPFAVMPGSNTSVTLRINAVGDLVLDSAATVVDPATPVLLSGDTTAWVDTHVNSAKSPAADTLKFYVLDQAGAATLSTKVLAAGNWPASPKTASTSVELPTAAGNYQLCVEEASGSAVLSRRYKLFSVELAATLSVDLNPSPLP